VKAAPFTLNTLQVDPLPGAIAIAQTGEALALLVTESIFLIFGVCGNFFGSHFRCDRYHAESSFAELHLVRF
jgi:hypothetical protein